MLPLYLKEYYKDDPIFKNSKVVVSVYGNEISGNLNSKMVSKIKFDEIESDTLSVLEKPTYLDLFKNAVLNSDGVVIASDETDQSIIDLANIQNKPVLKCGFKEGFEKEYLEFYSSKILS
jgi:starch synthase